jgi:hypothetical protein
MVEEGLGGIQAKEAMALSLVVGVAAAAVAALTSVQAVILPMLAGVG